MMLSENLKFFYLIQDIAGEESSECATRKRKAQSVSAITCWRKLSNIKMIMVAKRSSTPPLPERKFAVPYMYNLLMCPNVLNLFANSHS